MSGSGRRAAWLGIAAALALLGVGLVWLIARLQGPPSGPQPVVWDRTACAECRMAVSEPRYAAQLQTRDGRVLDFDDPGCLFLYQAATAPAVHAVYFHHCREERWLSAAEAGFVGAGPSPMDFNLGAVDREEAGAITVEAARAQALARRTDAHDQGAAPQPTAGGLHGD